ncbi:hypothetical protein [Streptomyces sp. KL2]|uniref:hypothetical protein n=1 Tax=Streptomyces sp. KL2 TaxID=3050126 RepID=UPI003978CA41
MRTTLVPSPSSGWADGLLSATEAASLLRERGVEARAHGGDIEVGAPKEWAMAHHTWGLASIIRAAVGQPSQGTLGPPVAAPARTCRAEPGTWTDVPDGAVAARVPLDAGRSQWYASRRDTLEARALVTWGAALTVRVVDGRECLQATLNAPTVEEMTGEHVPRRLVAAVGAALGEPGTRGGGSAPAGLVWGRGPARPSQVLNDLWSRWRESWGPEPDRPRLAQVVRAWGGLLSDEDRLELPWWRGSLGASACIGDLARCLGAEASGAASLPAFRRHSPPRRPATHRVGPALAALGFFEARTPCLREGGPPRDGGTRRVAQVRATGVFLRSDLVTGLLAPERRLPALQQGRERPWGVFEIGTVFSAPDGAALPTERLHLGIAVRTGGRTGRSVPAALALVRRAVDVAADALRADVRVGNVPRGALEAPLLGAGGRVVGRLRLHPPTGRRRTGQHGAVSAELALDAVLEGARVTRRGRPARAERPYGSATIDRSFVIGTDVTADQMLAVARSVKGIRDARSVEDFAGAPYGPGRHSLTVRLYLGAGGRPSERPEVFEVVEKLGRELGACPREEWRSDSDHSSNSHIAKDL